MINEIEHTQRTIEAQKARFLELSEKLTQARHDAIISNGQALAVRHATLKAYIVAHRHFRG